MVKWTDDEASDPPPTSRPSPRARVRALFGRRLTAEAASSIARCSAAVGLTLALLAFVMLRAGGPESAAVAAVVQAPTFAKLRQSVMLEPPAPDLGDVAAALTVEPARADLASLWTRPAFEFEQSFAEAPDRVKRLCEDFAAAGFAKARWRASAVFDGEWECSSALITDGRDDGTAFLVVRGSGEGRVRSLMLKLNPASPADRAALLDRAKPVVAEFLLAARAVPSASLLDRIMAGEPANFATSFGTVRIVAEYNRPDVRVLNLALSPTLDAPPEELCAGACFAGFRPPKVVLAATTEVAAR